MKALLTFVASLFCVIGVNAASPSFSSFYTNHFTTNNLVIKAKLNTNQFDTSTSSTNITITITNVSGVGGLLWTNDTSIGSSGRLMPIPGLDYAYVYPSNFYNHGWFTLQPEFHLLGSGTNTIGVEESSHLMFSMTNDPTEVIITLESGFAMGQELLLMSYTNTVFNGRFTLPADSVVSGGGLVKLNNNEDWLGANGSAIRLIWIEPDWWEQGRWTAGSNVTADVIWANVAGVIQPRGGQITNALQFISGSADAGTNTLLTLDTVNQWVNQNTKMVDIRHTGTNVAYWTPYGSLEVGRNIPWAFPGYDDILNGVHDVSKGESDYAILYISSIDGNTETNYSEFGATLNTGASPASVLVLSSVATNLVSSFNILLQPDQNVGRIELVTTNGLVWKVDDNGAMYMGPNSYTLLGPNNNALSVFRDVSLGDEPNTGMSLYARMTNGQGIGTYDLTIGTNSSFLAVGWNNGPSPGRGINFTTSSTETTLDMASLDGVRRVSFAPSTADGANATAHWVDTDTAWTLGTLFGVRNNGVDALKFGPDARITWGVGNTNELYRSGSNLIYENGATEMSFGTLNGAGNGLSIGTDFGGVPTLQSSTATLYMKQTGGAGYLFLNNSAFGPNNPNVIDNGKPGTEWHDGAYLGTLYIGGFNENTNYSRLAISHTGTNAGGSVILNSQAVGTAGVARPINFQIGGTNVVTFDLEHNPGSQFSVIRITNQLSGAYMTVGVFGSSPQLGASGNVIYCTANYIMSGGDDILTDTDNASDLGSSASNGAFKDTHIKGSHYVYISNDGVGNYSRLRTHTSGTQAIITPEAAGTGVPITVKVVYDAVNNVFDSVGAGTPEGAVTAGIGSTYRRSDGGAGTSFYVKESGTGMAGWVAK